MKKVPIMIRVAVIGLIASIVGGIISSKLTSYGQKNNEIETRTYESRLSAYNLFLDSYYKKFNAEKIKKTFRDKYDENYLNDICCYVRSDHLLGKCQNDPLNFLDQDHPLITKSQLQELSKCYEKNPWDCQKEKVDIAPDLYSGTLYSQQFNLDRAVSSLLKEFQEETFSSQLFIPNEIYEASIYKMEKQISNINNIPEGCFPWDVREIAVNGVNQDNFKFMNNEIIQLLKNEMNSFLQE